MSAKYMASGSFTFSPRRNAAVGLVGVAITSNFLNLQVVSVVVPGTERVRPQHDTSLYFCSKRLVARPLVHLGKRASLLGTVSVANTIETRQIRRRFSSCNDVIRRDGIFGMGKRNLHNFAPKIAQSVDRGLNRTPNLRIKSLSEIFFRHAYAQTFYRLFEFH